VKTYKIAIVGAGPSGYFTAQALQNAANDERNFKIDLIERLPTPWGLVRSGVAPDHPKIKSVSKVFEKIASDPNFRLFANVELGKDIKLADLKEKYDAVVLCTGSAVGKKLGIPGEELANSISAAEFVPWYNGHPDFESFKLDLNGKAAVVIGAGNVAMDCARMLALDPKELDSTDTAERAMSALHKSSIRKVYIAGRRGPEHASFTAPELRELSHLEHTDVYFNEEAIAAAISRASSTGEIEKHTASNLEAMKSVAESAKAGHERSMEFLFLHAPKAIIGQTKVEGITFGINEVQDNKVIDTGKTVTIPCDLVISAVGYESLPYEGASFEKGKIKNTDGRVCKTTYVVGWAKRGPSGVIGTNKSDAAAVVALLLEDLTEPKSAGDISDLISTEHLVVDQNYWTRINESEVASGEPKGKPRLKATTFETLLALGKN
jgi:ferredoxin--NADP+ reductase